jgi:CRISPR/Cas system-associated exonuclease Cas4 (RecB family)
MQLLLTNNGDERAGLPSASEYDRLLQCRASYLLNRKAHALGQVAHQWSLAADLGARKHLASTEGPEILSEAEREDWEKCQQKREAFIKEWLGNSQEPFSSVKEERLWLRRGIRPLLTGKPDEVLRVGDRAAVLDLKYGSYRVADPASNVQLSVYALLVSREDDAIEEVTVQILSPYFDFEPFIYTRAELDRLHQEVLVVLNSLSDPGKPTPGAHCQFCPGKMICSAARMEAENTAPKVMRNPAARSAVAGSWSLRNQQGDVPATPCWDCELPVGEPAANLLSQIKRAKSLFQEIEGFYKQLLEREPGAIPGWTLERGAVRRSIEDPVAAFERLLETYSVSEFVNCCSPSVPDLERGWARKKGQPASQAKESLKRLLGDLLTEKRNAPSLKAI